MMKAIIFDTETTGLVKNRTISLDRQPEIIELYACFVDLNHPEKIISEIEFLIRPKLTTKLDPVIEKITGLRYHKDLKDCEPFEHYAKTIEKFFKQSDYVIAHNIAFDRDMLQIEFERLGQEIHFKNPICTVEQTRHVRGFNLKLCDLYAYLFEKPMKESHRAKIDVQHLLEVSAELHKKCWLPVTPVSALPKSKTEEPEFLKKIDGEFKDSLDQRVKDVLR